MSTIEPHLAHVVDPIHGIMEAFELPLGEMESSRFAPLVWRSLPASFS